MGGCFFVPEGQHDSSQARSAWTCSLDIWRYDEEDDDNENDDENLEMLNRYKPWAKLSCTFWAYDWR
jgi:hypothetical protein